MKNLKKKYKYNEKKVNEMNVYKIMQIIYGQNSVNMEKINQIRRKINK